MKKRIIRTLALLLVPMLLLCGCGKAADTDSTETSAAPTGEHARVRFTMVDGGTFTMELYPEYAPKTVENFLMLVRDGFYDGLTFHRVFEGFMAQGGDGESAGKSCDSIEGEFASNGFAQNTLSHTRGVVSMARTGDPNSASSQFFICYDDAPHLDGNYAAFGKVIDGMETVDAFTKVEMTYNPVDGRNTTPATPIVIASAEVVA